MYGHAVPVRMADGGKVEDVIQALNAAGYVAGTPKRVEPEKDP